MPAIRHASAADADGHDHEHGEFNEHVWYSLDAMGKLADAVAAKLGELEPGSRRRSHNAEPSRRRSTA